MENTMKGTKKHINTHTDKRKIGDKQQTNPNSLKNLKPRWKAGESGNPEGRPIKNKFMIEKLKGILNEEYDSEEILGWNTKNKMTKSEMILRRIADGACKGDRYFINLLVVNDCLEIPE